MAGAAWHYTKYNKTAVLDATERNAMAASRGLWADAEPVPPWEWRKAYQHGHVAMAKASQ